jgi:hypothetical protein
MRSAWFPAMVVLIVGLWAYTRFVPEPRPAAEPTHVPGMPTKVTDTEERELYLTPGGLYTAADIEANGRRTASEAYSLFRAKHDANPQPGDAVCPITGTKADSRCVWVVGGRRFTFCCPPCIDEFVLLAKTDPSRIKPPEAYLKPINR